MQLIRIAPVIRIQRDPDAESGSHPEVLDRDRRSQRRLERSGQSCGTFSVRYFADNREFVAAGTGERIAGSDASR